MAGASDKARFYLEQYVPELQEYQRKGIFSSEEITAIASKRSDFEHTLNARGSKPSDYAKYASYEMNVDSLRKLRCKKLGVKTTAFSGQRTIFFILQRATKKFPGDMALWMQYIHFCQRENANKKLSKLFTQVLRLKPRDWGLWVLAAKHYAEKQGDMSTARSYMQRGLRFCKNERKLWLEYMRLEMTYLAKLAARRKILGLDQKPVVDAAQQDINEDVLMLPSVTVEDLEPDASKIGEDIDAAAIERLASAPVFNGGIPMAIFDAAMKQFMNSPEVAEELFEQAEHFDSVPSTHRILDHILRHLQTHTPDFAEAVICEARMPLFGVDAESVEFPSALGTTLAFVKKNHSGLTSKQQPRLAIKAASALLPYLRLRGTLDEDVVKVLEASVKGFVRAIPQAEKGRYTGRSYDTVTAMVTKLRQDGHEMDANILEELSAGLS